MLQKACAQAARRRDAGTPIVLSVNLSPRQIARIDLPAMVAEALAAAGLESSLLCLEITEGSLMDETAPVDEVMSRLKGLGVRISVDDFGTGYSSLGYLQRFPIDQLKIDRSFVTTLTEGAGNHALVAAIVDMAAALHLDVVAEGVEEPAQLAALRALGCRSAQGFLFARPAPPESIEPLLRTRLVPSGVVLAV